MKREMPKTSFQIALLVSSVGALGVQTGCGAPAPSEPSAAGNVVKASPDELYTRTINAFATPTNITVATGTKASDDGATYDPTATFNNKAGTCNGTWVDGWFLTGHGNGGVFSTVPSLPGSLQGPSQTVAAERYFYGTPGPCADTNNCGL